MFWIEESPTSACDDDSDVPFDETPGKPMACEEEIELIIRPDDDHFYPSKASSEEADEDTWPETLSQYGGTSTLVSNEVEETTKDAKDGMAGKDSADEQDDSSAESSDDDATQVMGEHHTVEGPEDERTFTSGAPSDSFAYLPPTVPSSSSLEPSNHVVSSVETPPEDRAESRVSHSQDASAGEVRTEEVAATLAEDTTATDAAVVPIPKASGVPPQQQQPDEEPEEAEAESGTTLAPVSAADADSEDAPDLIHEPIFMPNDDDDNDEHDAASMSEDYSETKAQNEMNDDYDDDQDISSVSSSSCSSSCSELDWYDRWEPLEQTDDGISCISNMFASIQSISGPVLTAPTADRMELPTFILASPTMTTVFSDGGADESQFATSYAADGAAASVKSEPQLREACYFAAPHIRQATSFAHVDCPPAAAAAAATAPKMQQQQQQQVILIVESDEEDNIDDVNIRPRMTLEEYLNSNCLQGTRKERRKRIMDRQRSALSRITPVVAAEHGTNYYYATEIGGAAPGAGHGFVLFDQLLDHFVDPIGQLQHMMGLAN